MHTGVKRMKNSLWIFLYVLLLVSIVFFEYQKKDENSKAILNHKYEVKNNKELDLFLFDYTKPLDNNFTINEQWGIVPPKEKKVKKEEIQDINKSKPIEVILKEKTLCIEKKCFKLLGIFLEKRYSSSFYIEEAKNKVQTFKVGEILALTIKIKSIRKNRIIFKDINSTNEWTIKMFDINSSKYKPKEF